MADSIDLFSLPVRTWFQDTFGAPTPPQTLGWPPIQRGEHTLILAPTGSGKTLAAFLWGIDALYRTGATLPQEPAGVRLLYISPLKALNNDIERNLRVPLQGIRTVAEQMGQELPELRVAVRTGDTPSHVRTAMWKKPPHILITTPESLYLMLTSPRAREIFRTVRTVIVDEIHTLAGNKRGVHLALSLERLNHLASERVQRIGLSATIKPLQEVARFLGGQEQPETAIAAQPRPVTIVNATYHKPLDLRVVTVVDDFRTMPGNTIWPYVIPRVLQDIREHHSTLIFANNRRLAERTADRLNAQLTAEESEEIAPGSSEALAPGGIAGDRGIFAIGAQGPIRAHHGSMSKEARREMEQNLKEGKLPALVGTGSLELGIDIGSVDLVVQLQSPKSVSQGLQRVGRSGHIVGETSVGRIYATFREDLVEAAAVARGMLEGDVEPTVTPQNPLDVLAQQIVAMVAVEDWSSAELYALVRSAYAYRDLSRQALDAVLGMLSGKFEPVRARIAWDPVNDRLAALPGSRLLAMSNPGTISDTGAYQVYLQDGKTKVGELDEEFVYETRVGDAFLLGSKVWRVLDIENDRIVVGDASGAVPRMPFWNGDYPWRPYELGKRIGKFRREVAESIQTHPEDLQGIEERLRRDYALDENSARNLLAHVQQQLNALGVMSSDQTIVVETFADAVGEPRMVIHSPFGGRVNGAWALALASAIRERTGVQPETQTNDDGIIFRFLQSNADPPVDLVREMSPAQARERILAELPNSALFGAHFRMNAARALLLPKARGQKRTPLWLQRLKAKDLLAAVRRSGGDDFPIVAETYRDCLRDVLDLPHLEQILAEIADGEIRLVPIETAVPSPVASALLFQFVSIYMYEWDAPKAERQLQALSLSRELVDDLLQGIELRDLLKPEAVTEVIERLQHLAPAFQARTVQELSVVLQELGDLSTVEIQARCQGDGRVWVQELGAQGRVVEVQIPTHSGLESRWALTELAAEYQPVGERALSRFLRASGPISEQDILNRYALDETWLAETLNHWVSSREIVRGHFSPGENKLIQYCERRAMEQIHRRTLSLLRKEVQPVKPSAFANFLAGWQHLGLRLSGPEGLERVLEQLDGLSLPGIVWERDILPARLVDFAPEDLDELFASGRFVWVAQGNRLRLFARGQGSLFLGSPEEGALQAILQTTLQTTSPDAQNLYGYLREEGASFATDLKADLKMSSVALSQALAELVMAGLITNDSLSAWHEVAGTTRRDGPASPTALEAELATRLGQRPRPLTRGRYQNAKRRVAQRLNAGSKPSGPHGRWSLVHRRAIMGSPLTEEERAAKLARILLARYGVVTRESLDREEGFADWGALYPLLQRMEMRGEVRRGYFITGLSGAQFALPEAVEQVRAPEAEGMLVLAATDPANPFGPETLDRPFRFARVPSTHIVLSRGRLVLVGEDNGERITVLPDADPDLVQRALEVYLSRPGAPRHTLISQWNGAPVLGSPVEPVLKALGFNRTPQGMER